MEFFANLNIPVILGWVFAMLTLAVPAILIGGMYLSGRKNKPAEEKSTEDVQKSIFGKNVVKKKSNRELIVKSDETSKESQVASIFGAPQELKGFTMPTVGTRVQMPPAFDNDEIEAALPPVRPVAGPPVLGAPKPQQRPTGPRIPLLPPPPSNLR